jgi:hypothetical protein
MTATAASGKSLFRYVTLAGSAICMGLVVPACRTEPEDAPTASEPAYDGLSREEIQRQAEQMTPAEAESLGIVDTTIRVEPPMNPDSLLLDSLARP